MGGEGQRNLLKRLNKHGRRQSADLACVSCTLPRRREGAGTRRIRQSEPSATGVSRPAAGTSRRTAGWLAAGCYLSIEAAVDATSHDDDITKRVANLSGAVACTACWSGTRVPLPSGPPSDENTSTPTLRAQTHTRCSLACLSFLSFPKCLVGFFHFISHGWSPRCTCG